MKIGASLHNSDSMIPSDLLTGVFMNLLSTPYFAGPDFGDRFLQYGKMWIRDLQQRW